MLPYDKDDKQQIQRKRHIGNGIYNIENKNKQIEIK